MLIHQRLKDRNGPNLSLMEEQNLAEMTLLQKAHFSTLNLQIYLARRPSFLRFRLEIRKLQKLREETKVRVSEDSRKWNTEIWGYIFPLNLFLVSWIYLFHCKRTGSQPCESQTVQKEITFFIGFVEVLERKLPHIRRSFLLRMPKLTAFRFYKAFPYLRVLSYFGISELWPERN
uniref:Uncharacterized protein n=1 Tax=Cucumis sativus TaxID=3659 RepID=A0A0A0KIZ5_CUCSA